MIDEWEIKLRLRGKHQKVNSHLMCEVGSNLLPVVYLVTLAVHDHALDHQAQDGQQTR